MTITSGLSTIIQHIFDEKVWAEENSFMGLPASPSVVGLEECKKEILKLAILPIIEKIHSIDSIKEKDKFVLELILELQKL